MSTRLLVLLLLFVVANIALGQLDAYVYRAHSPQLGLVAYTTHLLLLIVCPYHKLFPAA